MSDINGFDDFPSQSVKSVKSVNGSESLPPLTAALAALEYRQPELVGVADWQRAVDDGRRFMVQWGEQAETLGWTAEDLFGLHNPAQRPGPNYRRLSRYDVIGLVWLLHGRPVVSLTARSAVIGAVGGPAFYRR